MADFILTIPNAQVPRVVDGICTFFGYQAILQPPLGDPVPNPETRAQFVRRMLREQVIGWVKSSEAKPAKDTAEATVTASVEAIGISVS